ncbi:OmpA family protein [Falsiporphyromonas endometrii]|uniref:OmpA family protein n=2 Tax=Falsiporphyromonas endometrii TaxID=1387297 RepID=A0ABV9K8I6_9PORP
MKVKYLMLTLAGAFALNASAQEVTEPTLGQTPAKNTAYARGQGNDNWFVTLQGGASMMFLKDNEDAKFENRQSFIPTFSVGKWHNPYFATRVQLAAGVSHEFKNVEGLEDLKMFHGRYVMGHFDFMFDVINYFKPYREDRVFHLIPWVGLGYSNKFIKGHDYRQNALTGNAGVMFLFNILERMDIVLEAQASYSEFNLDRSNYNYRNDFSPLMGAVTAGLNFKLGDLGFNEILPMDMNLVNDLNGQINRLRAENEELGKRPVSCPECPEVEDVVEQVNLLGAKSVQFRFDNARVAKDQMVTLNDVAQYVKKNNAPIVVTGYADATGNASYNEGLSERRAKAVAKVLTDKFGVPADMITIEWKGASEQPYDKRDWNRVVIMRSK